MLNGFDADNRAEYGQVDDTKSTLLGIFPSPFHRYRKEDMSLRAYERLGCIYLDGGEVYWNKLS